MCDKCKEAGTFQHTIKLQYLPKQEVDSNNIEYLRSILDGNIKLTNPEFRDHVLRFDVIELTYVSFEYTLLTGVFKKLSTKTFKRP
ncbi:hypothetical protein MA9V2_100 [Chryseobacterium phage MA9V-2]|nr:hypothetical protein MA9V2_100 [Chryseobacterium phage MA9V-2]